MPSLIQSAFWTTLFLVSVTGCGDDAPGDDDDDDDIVADARIDSSSPDDAAIDGSTPDDAAIDGVTPNDATIDGSSSFDASMDGSIDIDGGIDGSAELDAATGDGGALPAVGTHLLITEVDTVGADEFIEIYNPTDQTIALDNYYLADIQDYFRLPAGETAFPVPFNDTDFVARFPTGSSIPPRGAITVATDGPQYATSYTEHATFSIDEADPEDTPMDLVLGISNEDKGAISLTNSGEMVILFYWDGASDLVQDVDLAIAGNNPSAGNTIIPKTAVDGPDGDDTASNYATDAGTIGSLAGDTDSDPALKESYKRIALESAANETQSGTGNGITGDDETSEMIQMTWTSLAADHTAATPGTVPDALNPPAP